IGRHIAGPPSLPEYSDYGRAWSVAAFMPFLPDEFGLVSEDVFNKFYDTDPRTQRRPGYIDQLLNCCKNPLQPGACETVKQVTALPRGGLPSATMAARVNGGVPTESVDTYGGLLAVSNRLAATAGDRVEFSWDASGVLACHVEATLPDESLVVTTIPEGEPI